MAEVIVLDASVIIALHDSRDRHHAWALDFFRNTLDSEWAMSVLTRAETLVQPIRGSVLNVFLDSVDGLGIRTIGLDAEHAEQLAHLRADTNLRMPDAIVLQAALNESAALATCDQALARCARDRNFGVFAPAV